VACYRESFHLLYEHYGLNGRVSIPDSTRDVTLFHSAQAGSGTHPASCSAGSKRSFLWGKLALGEAGHFRPSAEARNGVATFFSPIHTHGRCFLKFRDDFAFERYSYPSMKLKHNIYSLLSFDALRNIVFSVCVGSMNIEAKGVWKITKKLLEKYIQFIDLQLFILLSS
jgi:hypothetical protein